MFYEEQSAISDAFRFQEWSLGTGNQSKEERDEAYNGFLSYVTEVQGKIPISKSSHCEYCSSFNGGKKPLRRQKTDVLCFGFRFSDVSCLFPTDVSN